MNPQNEEEWLCEDQTKRGKCEDVLNDRREAVLGMELRVRIEEDRRKVEASQSHDKDICKLVHAAKDCIVEGMTEHLMAFDKTNYANQLFEDVSGNGINVLAEKEKAAEVSETVEDKAIIRNNQSYTKETLQNGCGIGLDLCQARSKFSGMDQIVEIEAGKKHEAVIFNHANQERSIEVSGPFVDRKRINPEADLEAEGSERIKKNLKLEGVHKETGVDLEDCHTQMPDTTHGKKLETLGCNEGEGSVIPRPPCCKKKKVALFVAYCGVGYQGMQKNPGAVTIEGDLEEALFKAGAIGECNFGDLRKVDWTRAARTDKGVSAVGQVVSGKFVIDPPGFVERVNSLLPEQIRVLGFKRVTNTFSAKNMCDRRRYEYVLPVFAFDPSVHQDRESMKGIEREKVVMRCNEDRQEKKGESSNGDIVLDSLEHTSNYDLQEGSVSENSVQRTEREVGVGFLEAHQERMDAEDIDRGMVVRHSTESAVSFMGEIAVKQDVSNTSLRNDDELLGSVAASLEPKNGSKEALEKPKFKFGDRHVAQLNNILGHYIGTHNFHNFTSRIKPEDPSANRYIVSFEVSSVFAIGSMEFVKCKVVGQSFILHQIRKMIGLAVAIMCGCAPISTIETALRRDVNINVPMAPELGLFLDECMFTSYNEKFSSSHEKISLHDFEKEIADFKWKQIYSHIASTEARDGVVALWLHSLNGRNYTDSVLERQKTK